MKRKLILTLTILLVLTALATNNHHTQPLIPTAHAESDQCPVIRQVCKEMWDRMYVLCRLDGVIQEQCDAIRAVELRGVCDTDCERYRDGVFAEG